MRLTALLLLLAPLPAAAQDTVRTEADGSRTLVTEAIAPASPAFVWKVIATVEGWGSWAATHAWATDDPDVIETAYAPDARPGQPGNIRQRIVSREPGRRIVFRTIKTPEGFPHAAAFMGVTHDFEIAPDGSGTRLRLTGTNYPAGEEGDALLGFFKRGNRITIDRLVARLAAEPVEWLVGHCWRGLLPNGAQDTHCFTRGEDGVHDAHDVLAGGKKVYWGDTLYAWDSGAKALRFAYTAMSGGRMTGHVRAIPEGLDFGSSDFVGSDGKHQAFVTRWLRIDDNAYDARDETPGRPAQVVRYTRID